MTTKSQDTSETDPDKVRAIQRRALKRFGQAVFDAAAAYEAVLREARDNASAAGLTHVPYPEPYSMGNAVVAFVGMTFLHAADDENLEFDPEELRTLRRVHAALRPHVDDRTTGEAVEIAERIVARIAATTPREQAPIHLALYLGGKVHRGFFGLRNCLPEVAALVARFSAGKGRRAKKGELSKLSAAGILCELNKLTRDPKGRLIYPLGRGLTPNAVDRAIDRFRK